MSRLKTLGLALAALALGAVVGTILGSVWLGLVIGLIVAIVIFISGQSGRGGNQGVNDEGHGIEL
ncbi:hypothetical protein [Microbacterium halophytorum]|uniref:hypothetical protein n=1 Tax=Microbacterium halophytorum TaxID=2067568 RepID=UPI000CFB1ABD|nr:hypothetical protein [Microbacterium halophytorum]